MAAFAKIDIAPLLQNVPENEPEIAKLQGSCPTWLTGAMLRNGPGLYEVGDTSYDHLFDGLAILQKWAFDNGTVEYSTKYLHSKTYEKNIKSNRIVVSEFGTCASPDPCKSIFDRYFSYYFKGGMMTDNALVNITNAGDQVFALTETPNMCRIDPKNLETIEKNFNVNKIIALNTMTAHPHCLPNGDLLNMGTGNGYYGIFRVPKPDDGETECAYKKASIVTKIPFTWKITPSYYHSFGMTEKSIIFIETPVKLNLPKLLTSHYRKRPFSEAMDFYEEEKTHIYVRPMQPKENAENDKTPYLKYHTRSMFTFHHANAFETEDYVVSDFAGYENGDLFKQITLNEMRKGALPPNTKACFWRLIMPKRVPENTKPGDDILKHFDGLKGSKARAVLQADGSIYCEHEELCDIAFEFPRINYDYNGKPYTYCYGSTLFDRTKNGVLKLNVNTGEYLKWSKDHTNQFPGEPVFVARPGAEAEDDGVVLCPVSNTAPDEQGFLLILNAATLEEMGRAYVPQKVPFAFHAHYLRNC